MKWLTLTNLIATLTLTTSAASQASAQEPAQARSAPQAGALSLEQALQQARQHNETWELTSLRIESAQQSVLLARSALFPRVGAAASVTRNPELVELQGRVIQPLYSWSASADASLVLLDATVWSQMSQARAQVEQARADATWQRATLEFEVVQTWTMLWAMQEQVALLDEILALRQEDVARAQALVKVERGLPLDVKRASADLLETTQRRLVIEASRADLADSLAALMGRDSGEEIRAAATPSGVAAPLDQQPQDLSQRADFRARQRAIDAAEYAEEAQARAWFPTLGLSAGASLGPPTLSRPNGGFWSVTLGASWAIFDGGARSHRADLLATQTQTLRVQQTLLLRQEGAALRAARRQYEVARASAPLLTARSENAQEALRLAKLRYSAGTASSLEIRDATASILDARTALLNNELAVHIARARIQFLQDSAREDE